MARLPAVLDSRDLPLAELCAARIDGELMRLGERWCPIDEPDLPALRAAAIAPATPTSTILERRSAAWVHGALAVPPRTIECCVPHTERVSVRSIPSGVRLREVAITPDEVASIGGIRCTRLDRTIYDLVRDPHAAPEVVGIVAGLLAIGPGAGQRARERIERAHRMPHKSVALERLAEAAARPEAAA
ncbi:hypothetical protein [Agromyces sp. SYSU T0242]|uniref:hypothetical protein n=1 Tax=Agromyces litoreus TaxID=3158561 RepID=UPI0033975FEF